MTSMFKIYIRFFFVSQVSEVLGNIKNVNVEVDVVLVLSTLLRPRVTLACEPFE